MRMSKTMLWYFYSQWKAIAKRNLISLNLVDESDSVGDVIEYTLPVEQKNEQNMTTQNKKKILTHCYHIKGWISTS